ncbi:MAG: hypothetical protein JXA07_03855 [Spirochaetes bacterium]|nr:hypothetical protein [Spirochaetota bacterium]
MTQAMADFVGMGASHWVIFFAVYSFIGWIIEVIYRSSIQRRFINAGFLYGMFIPIYGFGALFVLVVYSFIRDFPDLLELLVYGVVLTAVEYAVGFLFEKIFKLKLWDYSNNRFNLHGRICLLFSLFWTALALVFVTFIHPVVARYLLVVDERHLTVAAFMFLAYMGIDVVFSVSSITAFRNRIAYLYDEYFNLSNVEIEKILNSFQRLRSAFPNLNRYIDSKINIEIKNRVNSMVKSVQEKIFQDLEGRRPFEKEFYDIVRDICEHEEFLRLKGFFHHNSSIYDHVRDVAYFSYQACKLLKLDYRSAARGAMLHDFFLYDWRNHDEPELARDKFHGFEHPRIALENAAKYFKLNDIERDIIVKHMWPLTLVPPKYKESFIVTFADKYLSSKEFLDEFARSRARKRNGRPRMKARTAAEEKE